MPVFELSEAQFDDDGLAVHNVQSSTYDISIPNLPIMMKKMSHDRRESVLQGREHRSHFAERRIWGNALAEALHAGVFLDQPGMSSGVAVDGSCDSSNVTAAS